MTEDESAGRQAGRRENRGARRCVRIVPFSVFDVGRR